MFSDVESKERGRALLERFPAPAPSPEQLRLFVTLWTAQARDVVDREDAAERRREKAEPPGDAAAARRSEPPTLCAQMTGQVENSVPLRVSQLRRSA